MEKYFWLVRQIIKLIRGVYMLKVDCNTQEQDLRGQRGFTLIEISIVLIIIGFIIAGVAAGQSLIHQARLRSVVSDFNSYNVAIRSFRSSYGQLPGDFNQATHLFGDVTRNGNGDGWINWNTSPAESALVWQHLALGGFIKGNYSGEQGSELGYDRPSTAIPNATFAAQVYFLPGWLYDEPQVNTLEFGKIRPLESRASEFSVLTPADAANIDTKMDDGMPVTGYILGATGFDILNPPSTPADNFCASGSGASRVYNLSVDKIYCILILKLT